MRSCVFALLRQLGVSYPTAWLLHHKINRAMAAHDDGQRLGRAVQLDDAYLGGERTGVKAGRGSENKLPLVAAVSLYERGQPLHLKLNLVIGLTLDAISRWAQANLAPKTHMLSDGLGCFAAVADARCFHTHRFVGALKPRDLLEFKWINSVPGNLKTSLAGTFHSLDYREYAQPYLGAFAYRFNHCFDLRGLVATLIADVPRCALAKRSVITTQAEPYF